MFHEVWQYFGNANARICDVCVKKFATLLRQEKDGTDAAQQRVVDRRLRLAALRMRRGKTRTLGGPAERRAPDIAGAED